MEGFELSLLKQYRSDLEQEKEATNKSLLQIKDDLRLGQTETMAQLDRIDTDLRSQMSAVDKKGEDLERNINKQLTTQDEQQKKDMSDMGRKVGDLEQMTSKHESELTTLYEKLATGVNKERVDWLEEECNLCDKRNLRLENVLGLEPMTREDIDPKKGLKQKASSLFLSDDQLLRKGWLAWMGAIREAKQNQHAKALSKIQEMLKSQNDLIESEKTKLQSASEKVQSLEADHTKLSEELQNLRKSKDLNDGYWKGMTRGLQVAKKTMHTEGDGEMIPSATRLRNALPPLTDLATSRPATTLSSSSRPATTLGGTSRPAPSLS
jgi:chromosome segregation ATPase